MQINEDDVFEIQKQLYNTQWVNIRHHWEETIKAIRYLSTLIVFAILPLKFLRITKDGNVDFSLTPQNEFYLKFFVISMISVFGLLTFLSQFNHYMRSKEARKVVVEIEKRWGLYDEKNQFIYQPNSENYKFGSFAGGEKRMTHTTVLFGYIISITVIGIGFVVFA